MSLIVKAGKTGKQVLYRILPQEKRYVSYTRRVERVKTPERVVAMTFEGGPMDLPAVPDKFSGRSLTDVLLDTLGEYGAQGTFLVVGDTGENYPDVPGRPGQAGWSGVRYSHCPDINQDERGGAANNPRLMSRILQEGHQAANYGYRHIPFGKRAFVYGKREHGKSLEEAVADQTRLHTLLKKTYGYEMTMGTPPWGADRIDGCFTAGDVYDQMGYLYLASSFDGGGRVPVSRGSVETIRQAEITAMTAPMEKLMAADPDALRGQIIRHQGGYNMARRTPVAFGLKNQLELLRKYGYRVVTARQLVAECPFSDVGPEEPGFEKLVRLQKTRGIVCSDNCLRLDAPMTWGELAMLLAPRREAVNRRIQRIRETGKPQHPHWGAMDWCAEQGILKYAMEPDETVKGLPREFFDPVQGLTRRQIYEAFRG